MHLPSRTPCELALDHFDAFYKPHFKQQWPSIRVSLLSLSKYAAIVNNASDAELTTQTLAELGARDLIQDAAVLVHKASLKGDSLEKVGSRTSQDEDPGKASDDVVSLEHSGSDVAEAHLEPEACQVDGKGSEGDEGSHDMKNVLTPADAARHSADLQHFMPTQQVFSEKEALRQEEYLQNVFQERPVSVSVLPGQYPRLPPCLKVMAFPPGDVSDFPTPTGDQARLLSK